MVRLEISVVGIEIASPKTQEYHNRMKIFRSLVFSVTVFTAIAADAQKTTIEGQLLDEKGQPLHGAEIRIQSYDQSIGGFGVKTDADGLFAAKMLPPSAYRVTIRVHGEDVFAANNIRTRPGDPWRIDYNIRKALVTISTAHSNKIRRFAYQGERVGSQISGHWVETTSPDGYEPESQHVEVKNGTALLREMQKGHPGTVQGQ